MDHSDATGIQEDKRNAKPLMRNRKGWKGYVWGYNDWLKSDGYENVEWNDDPAKSGALDIVVEGNKTIYKF